jgi:hypothetical protein
MSKKPKINCPKCGKALDRRGLTFHLVKSHDLTWNQALALTGQAARVPDPGPEPVPAPGPGPESVPAPGPGPEPAPAPGSVPEPAPGPGTEPAPKKKWLPF